MNIRWPLLYWPSQHSPSSLTSSPKYFSSGITPLRKGAPRPSFWPRHVCPEPAIPIQWCQSGHTTLDKPRRLHSGTFIASLKNEVLFFLWGTGPVEYKSGGAGDHCGERGCQRIKTWVEERKQESLMTMFLCLDAAWPDAATHTLGLPSSLVSLSQFELGLTLTNKKY